MSHFNVKNVKLQEIATLSYGFQTPPPCLLYLALYIFIPLNPLLNKTTQDADTSYMTWAIYGGPDAERGGI